MIMKTPLLFCLVLRYGDEWLIEAEWPDGSIEHVRTFKAHSDAVNWVKTRSEAWLHIEYEEERLKAAVCSLGPLRRWWSFSFFGTIGRKRRHDSVSQPWRRVS
jgi:hypothetical protein